MKRMSALGQKRSFPRQVCRLQLVKFRGIAELSILNFSNRLGDLLSPMRSERTCLDIP